MASDPRNILGQFVHMLDAFRLAGEASSYLNLLLAQIGWKVEALREMGGEGAEAVTRLKERLEAFAAVHAELVAMVEQIDASEPPTTYDQLLKTLDTFLQALQTVQKAVALIEQMQEGVELPAGVADPQGQFGAIGEDLVSWAKGAVVARAHPAINEVLELLTIIDYPRLRQPPTPVVDEAGRVLREPVAWAEVKLGRLLDLLADPAAALKPVYLPIGEDGNFQFVTQADMEHVADRIFGQLRTLSVLLDLPATYGYHEEHRPDLEEGADFAQRMFTIYWPETSGKQMDMTLALSPKEYGGLGLTCFFYGDKVTEPIVFGSEGNQWQVTFDFGDTGVEGIALGSEKRALILPENITAFTLGVRLEPIASSATEFLLGNKDFSHLLVRTPVLDAKVSIQDGVYDCQLSAQFGAGSFAVENLLITTWDKLVLAYAVGADETTLTFEGLKLNLPFVKDLFTIELDLTLVYQKGELQPTSRANFRNPALGDLQLERLGWQRESFRVQLTDEGLVVSVGKTDFTVAEGWSLGWDALTLTLGVGKVVRLDITSFYVQTTLADLRFVADLGLVVREGVFQPEESSFVLRKPALDDVGAKLPWQNIKATAAGLEITFGKQAPIAIAGDLKIGWGELTVKLAGNGALLLDVTNLRIETSGYTVLADVGVSIAAGDIKLTRFVWHKPDVGDLLGAGATLHLDERGLVLHFEDSEIGRWLSAVAPNVGDEGQPGKVALRIFFSDGNRLVRQVRLDWRPTDERTLSLPGIAVTLPKETEYTVVMDGEGSERQTAFVVTPPANGVVVATSSFSWSRGDGDNLQRELQNDRKKASKDILTVTFAPFERISLKVAALSGKKLPRFFRLLQTALPQPPGDALGEPASLTEGMPTNEDGTPAKWEGKLMLGSMNLPFLQPTGTGQMIEIGKLPQKVDILAEDDDLVASFNIPITVKLGRELALTGQFAVNFSLTNFAIGVNHGEGLDLYAQEKVVDGDLLGLRWRFEGRAVERDGVTRYHVAKLTTDKYDYRLMQAEGSALFLEYWALGEDPIIFQVENFQLSEAGINLHAEVLPRPARLNGLDTKFTFAGSGFDIFENRIQAFTLKGSGPLPPALVGEAVADVALEFEQKGDALILKEGSANLQTKKPLKCEGTRFQFNISAMGLKFHYDGKYHLYFTLSGDAQFVPAPGDDANGPLALLSAIKITLVDCPLTGDVSVLIKHVKFLIKLPTPKTFSFMGCFEMEVRAIAFLPQADVFGGDGAMQITGQLRFAQGKGDNKSNQIDLHSLYIGLPEKGKFIPRIHFNALPVSISMGDAFELSGIVYYYDDVAKEGMMGRKGFAGEGIMKMQGMPTIEASFAFLRVQRDPSAPWVRAWFIYVGVRQISLEIPFIKSYLREVGLGFGYRYTLVSIKRADEIDDMAALLRELRLLGRTQGNLNKVENWAVDLEKRGQSPRWTIAMRAMFAEKSAAIGLTDWNLEKEQKLSNLYLLDAVAALRSDLTFFMAVRGWINTNYGDMVANPALRDIPLFSGFVLLTPKKKRFLAQLASNPDGHTGTKPEMPKFFKDALKNSQFAATLLIEPGLVHMELGWPNQLRWHGSFGLLRVDFRGGSIIRVSKSEFVIGTSFLARGSLEVGASLDLGFAGAAIKAVATVAFGARYIGVVGFRDTPNTSAFYGAIGLEARIDFSAEAWIRFQIRINLGFKKIRITIEVRVRFVLQVDFTAGLEIGILFNLDTGLRGSGTVSVSALGHRLELTADFAFNPDAVRLARSRTEKFLHRGLEASDVEANPGIRRQSAPSAAPAPAQAASAFQPAAAGGIAPPATTEEGDVVDSTPPPAAEQDSAADPTLPPAGEQGSAADPTPPPAFTTPGYIFYVIRDPDDGQLPNRKRRCYFLLMPAGESSTDTLGFLPTPPSIVPADIAEDFRLQIPKLPDGVEVEQYIPPAEGVEGGWSKIVWQDGDSDTSFHSWKAKWDATIFEKDDFKEQIDETPQVTDAANETAGAAEVVTLADYLMQAYLIGFRDAEDKVVIVSPTEPLDETNNFLLFAVQDPPFAPVMSKVADERVHNPSAKAYESAVRGAFEQFRGSPHFKRDPNSLYDNLLAQAFDPSTSIYAAVSTNGNGSHGLNAAAVAHARQYRGSVIEALIGDTRAYALAEEEKKPDDAQIAQMPAFQLGLVFRIEVEEDDMGRPRLPEWLDGFAGGAKISQRVGPEATAVSDKADAAKEVRPFNVSAASFEVNLPVFDRVQHYTDANTIAIAWELKWTTPLDDAASPAQKEPEQHLCTYEVRRRSLDVDEPEVVSQRSAVQILHRRQGENALTALLPRFKVVDHFAHETLEEQAALPVTGRAYLYTITPIDFGGHRGRPLTLIATRYPSEPPQVPVDAELRVLYHLPLLATTDGVVNDMTGGVVDVVVQEAADGAQRVNYPELLAPVELQINWSEPQVVREGPRVAVEEYRLIFRRRDTLPIGSYGLDSSVQGPRAKSLSTSNALPLPGDVVIPLSAGGPIGRRSAYVSRQTLLDAGILPAQEEGETTTVGDWQPTAWSVYIQTIAINGVPSALAPVKLILEVGGGLSHAVEERQVAQLEWLPHPFSPNLRLDYLPPEDLAGITGDAYVPMPNVQSDMLFADATPLGAKMVFGRHPDALRCVRFRWNQGPSDQPSYPLDLHAGYYLQQLDIDAYPKGAFGDAERLARALTEIQEVQMVPADDLYVTPGDTIVTSRWEAWYPSAVQRLEGTAAGAPAPPWYSWRESRLLWPLWPQEAEPNPDTDDVARWFFHPLLRALLDALAADYGVDLQAINATQAKNLVGFLEATAGKSDPYGWGLLQRFGMSVTIGLRDPDSNDLLYGDALINALWQAWDGLVWEGKNEYLSHLNIELLVQPAKSIELERGGVTAGSLLSMAQISLRPVVEQIQRYSRLQISAPPKSVVTLVFGAAPRARTLVIQSLPRGDGEQQTAKIGEVEIEANKGLEHSFAMPLHGVVNILLRGAKEDVKGPLGVWFALRQPLRLDSALEQLPELAEAGITTNQVETQFNAYFVTAATVAGATDPKGHIRLKGAVSIPPADADVLRHKFATDADRKLTNVKFDPADAVPQIFDVSDPQYGKLTSYFTAPEVVDGYDVAAAEGHERRSQWDYFVARVRRVIGSEMEALPTGDKLKDAVLAYFVWAQRFFDAGGKITSDAGNSVIKTANGPWLALAYPRTGTPAYVSPDANGRLQYDHLLEDPWAHNYRYYVRPYSRYDLLWRSLYESDKLLPPRYATNADADAPVFVEPPHPETAMIRAMLDFGPDPEAAALDIVLDRTYPIARPVVLRSSRLDFELPGQATPPGATWEVIVARHWEQKAIENNKMLERQLGFRQISFSLLRRFAFPDHLNGLRRALSTQLVDGAVNPLQENAEQYDIVSNSYPAIPASYLSEPAAVDFKTSDPQEALALALPDRIGRFQEGALVIQWDRLPYYYEHKLLLVAQTTTDVSPVNAIVQRDFEYRAPVVQAAATWVEEGGQAVLAVSLPLARYWDCLPANAADMWKIEDADELIKEENGNPAHLKLSALPDLEVVYLLVEEYMGNVEVQFELSFQAEGKDTPFTALRYSEQRFAAINPAADLKLAPPPTPTAHFALGFRLRSAKGKFEAGPVSPDGFFTTAPLLSTNLQEELVFEQIGDNLFKATYTGFLTEAKARELYALFDNEADRKLVQELYNLNVSTTRSGALAIRTLRGSAQPQTLVFAAPKLSDTAGV